MKPSLLILTAFLLVGCGAPGDDDAVGSTAPEIKVDTLIFPSSKVSLQKMRGKVVLLDFWATWCGPCRQITPTLEKIYADRKAEGLEAMAITDEAREIVAINEKQRPHTMPVYLDPAEQAHKAFGAQSLPTILVVDRRGQIVYRTAGIDGTTPTAIAEAVDKALRAG